MSLSSGIIRLAAAALPPAVRERYREEWLADLAGSDEAGATRAGVAAGALALAARIDRDDPVVSGLPRGALALRRARWGAAFVGVGLLLAVGLLLRGAWPERALGDGAAAFVASAVSPLLLVAAFLALGAGALLLAVAVRTALRLAPPLGFLVGILVVGLGGVLLAVLLIGSMMLLLFLPLVAGAAWVVLLLVVPAQGGAPTGSGRRTVAVAVGMLPLIAAVVAFGVLHITVWNPLAKLPGLSLDEIYAGLAAARELPSPAFLGVWAGSAVLAGVGIILFASLPIGRLRAARSPRRVLVMGLAVVAATALSIWVAGFGMGMGIADAFGTSGGDAGLSSVVPVLVGLLAGIPAVLLGTVPGPRPRPVQPVGS